MVNSNVPILDVIIGKLCAWDGGGVLKDEYMEASVLSSQLFYKYRTILKKIKSINY